MLNIAIDLGSFSVKALFFKVEKRKVKYLGSSETIIDRDEFNIFDENALNDLQLKIVKEIILKQEDEYSLILNSPSDLLTSRILELPVNNRKKANLMLPFQLETDLPYSLSSCHYASSIEIGKKTSSAMVSIAQSEEFNQLFYKLKLENIKPKVLTSGISYYSSFIKNHPESLPLSFCILDIGHSTTKAYFFIGQNLVSNHISHIAGHSIDESISENYNISREEASIYKHQNSFLLVQNQYESVNEDQRKFADLMDSTLDTLVQDFQRWLVGFKVKFADDISEIFVTGGSANIKNINAYLTEKTGIKTSTFESFAHTNAKKLDQDIKFRNKFANLNVLCQGYTQKNKLINLLSSKYSLAEQENLPLDKFAFVAVRVAAICLVIALSLGIERVLISSEVKELNKKITSVLKNPAIELNRSIKNRAKSKPRSVLTRIKSQNKEIKQEVSLIQSAIDTNSLISLKNLANMMGSLNDVELISFQSLSAGNFTAIFKVETQEDVNKLDKIFKNSSSNVFAEANLPAKEYKVNGSDNL